MARGMRVEVIGDKELKAKIQRLGVRAQGALVKAHNAAADPIVAKSNSKAPGPHVHHGTVKVDGGRAESSIGPDKEHWHYQFAETGSTSHEIKAGREARRQTRLLHGGRAPKAELQEATASARLAFIGRSGRLVVVRSVNHPGHPAEPFLRPAVEEERESARDAAGRVFRAEIEKECEG